MNTATMLAAAAAIGAIGLASCTKAPEPATPAPAAAPAAAQPAPRADIPNTPEAVAEIIKRFESWKTNLPPGTGPFAIKREEVASLPRHTIFRPAELSSTRKLPLVAFANGGCRNTPIEFTAFLDEIASQGYFIIAAGTNDVEFATDSFGPTADGTPRQIVTTEALTDGIDWAIKENARKDSPFFGKLDTKKVAYMGQSCGGMQALSASRDPRTTTTIVLNSGRFKSDRPVGLKDATFPPSFEWSDLHAPIAYFTGGPKDIQASHDNYAEIDKLPVFLADLPVGHTGAYPTPDLRWSKAVVGWLNWTLKGDKSASKLFVGADCGLCKDPDWTVTGGKKLDQIR